MKNYTAKETRKIFSDLFQKLKKISEKNKAAQEWHYEKQFVMHDWVTIEKPLEIVEMHNNFIEKLEEKHKILKEYYAELQEIFYITCSLDFNSCFIKQERLFNKIVSSADIVELCYKGRYHKVVLLYIFPYEDPLWAIYLGPQKVFR